MTGPCRRATRQRHWSSPAWPASPGRPAGGPPPICSWAIWRGLHRPTPPEELWPSAELVCAARTVPEELTAFLREAFRPELTVLVKTPETAESLEELAPFTEAYPIPETGVRYYLCRNGACARPVDSISEVGRLLEQN